MVLFIFFMIIITLLILVLLCDLPLSGVKRLIAWSCTFNKGFMFGAGSDLIA